MSDRPNKHRERTEEVKRAEKMQMVNDIVVNDIEAHNFDKLVRQGVVVREKVSA